MSTQQYLSGFDIQSWGSVREAETATDPFGLVALAEANQGTTLEEGMEEWEEVPSTLPPHRSSANTQRLMQDMTYWLTTSPGGTVTPDPRDVWPDNATGTDDFRFNQSTGSTSGVVT